MPFFLQCYIIMPAAERMVILVIGIPCPCVYMIFLTINPRTIEDFESGRDCLISVSPDPNVYSLPLLQALIDVRQISSIGIQYIV